MLAFNQFSTAPALLSPPDGGTGVGGLGRKGATKLVIYETESMAEADAADLAHRLEAGGFGLFEAGQDTIAVKRTTETFRRKAAPLFVTRQNGTQARTHPG